MNDEISIERIEHKVSCEHPWFCTTGRLSPFFKLFTVCRVNYVCAKCGRTKHKWSVHRYAKHYFDI